MERSRFLAWALVAALAMGCSSKSPPQTSQAATGGASGSSEASHTGSHFVVRPVDPTAPAEQPGAASPTATAPAGERPLAPPASVYQPLDPQFSATEPQPDITPIPSPVDAAFNPLRLAASPPVAPPQEPEEANPLRDADGPQLQGSAEKGRASAPRCSRGRDRPAPGRKCRSGPDNGAAASCARSRCAARRSATRIGFALYGPLGTAHRHGAGRSRRRLASACSDHSAPQRRV